MRFAKILVMSLSLFTVGWGQLTPAHAASDQQTSRYSVYLTPPTASGSSNATVINGSANDQITGSSAKTPSTATTARGTSSVTVLGQQPTKSSWLGRLPQTSEQTWGGLTLLGIILLLLFWVWKLSRRDRRS